MISAALAILETDEQRNELDEFYKENIDKLYSIAILKLHNQQTAEDAIQETFLRICRYPQKFFEIEVHKRLPYAVIIIRNVIYDMLRKNRMYKYDDLTDDIVGNEHSVEDIALENVFTEELEKFIRSMPEALKQAITLKLTYDMTNRQIAVALGISEEAARKRISNAYKQIKGFLNGGFNNGKDYAKPSPGKNMC